MNRVDEYNNAVILGWKVLNANTRHLYENQFIDGVEQACRGAFVAASIMTTAVFAAYAEWFETACG